MDCDGDYLRLSKDRTLQGIIGNSGDKYTAMEVIGELDKIQNNSIANRSKSYLDVNKLSKPSKLSKHPASKDSYISTNISSKSKVTNTQHKIKEINTECYDLKEIKLSLVNSAETVVRHMLGDPNHKLSSAAEWRYGNKGSLIINMAGTKKGLWYNFETGESGDLISLLQKDRNLTFSETLKYASTILGGGFYNTQQIQKNNTSDLAKQSAQKNSDAKNKKTKKYAQRLAKESQPIAGTIVEKYLKNKRGIEHIESSDVRFHPKVYVGKNEVDKESKYLPAMLSVGRDKNGSIQCVQATYLDPKTGNKAEIDVKKRTYSSPSGALVLLDSKEGNNSDRFSHNANKKVLGGVNATKPNSNHITFITEGVETGLSIRDATKDIKNSEVAVTLGKSNFAQIDPDSIGNKVIFCLDNDGPKTFTDSTIHKAAERLINLGKEIFITTPEQPNSISSTNAKEIKTDFNDVARNGGIAAVKNNLDGSMMTYDEWKDIGKSAAKVDLRGNSASSGIVQLFQEIGKNNALISNKYLSMAGNDGIDFSKSSKFIDAIDNDAIKNDLNNRNQTQDDLSKQKNIDIANNFNINDAQKSLSVIEKEIY